MMKESAIMDQEVLLDELQTRASQAAALMKKSLESGNVRDGIKYADEMLKELGNPFISPKFYYVLCTTSDFTPG